MTKLIYLLDRIVSMLVGNMLYHFRPTYTGCAVALRAR